MQYLKFFMVMMMPLLLSACQSTGLFLANLPTYWSDYVHTENVKYGNEPWQTLDIYAPKNGEAPHSVVVFFYGGGWSSGNKEDYRFVADQLTREGFLVVIPDYVKYPEAKFPTYQHDAAKATAWVHGHIEQYGGNRDLLHLMGHSAGAHIGAMLLANDEYLATEGLKPDVYNSFVGLAGPYNFTPKARKYVDIFGPPEKFPAMKVSNFIDGNEPPMLLLHGANDYVVSELNAKTLSEVIEQKGGKAQYIRYEGIGHINIIGGFSRVLTLDEPVIEDTIAFFRQASRR